jgi:hypothetical protein
MKRILPFSLVVIAALILAACVSSRSAAPLEQRLLLDGGAAGSAPAAPVANEAPMPMAPAVASDQSTVSNEGTGASASSADRIVIQNADLAIVVSDVKGRMKNIQVMAQQMGGFVVSSNLYQSYTSDYVEVPEAQITIRVPSEKLEDALEQIKKDVVEVQNETRTGKDVTAEYVDLQSRLKNYEAAEAQLEKILETATKTEDVVSIFNQLVYYREQIELVKGQINYYDEATALSAINIRIVAEETVKPVVIGKWEPKGAALEAAQDLINFLKDFTELTIRFVIYILPSWLIVGIPLYLIFLGGRAIFRRFNKTSPAFEQDNPISRYIKSNNDETSKITDIGGLEQKIKEGEALLMQSKSYPTDGLIPLIISFGILIYVAAKIPRSEVYLILTGFGLVYLGFNIWRMYSANKQKKEIEFKIKSKLKEYQDKRAELREASVEKK